jgi:sigma-B regulation protein RsbU (phosphoserine phosphatase)
MDITTNPNPEQPSSDRLELLYRLSQAFNSSLDLDEVLSRVMDEVIAALGAERGFLMLRDGAGELVFRVARGLDHRAIQAPEFQVSRGVVERVALEGQPQLTSDAQSEEWLSGRPSVMSLGLRSVMCVPLQLKGTTMGVIYVDNRLQAGIFTEADLDLLSAIASSAAIAIENARLYQVAVEKGRMERELQVAREVQTSLIPRRTPDVAGWDFAARWRPALEVSGDFYDFVPADGRLGVVIGDVSDKGMPAALFMALSRSIIRASVTSVPSPAGAIRQANRLISADSTNSMFVTLFFAQLDPASGELAYVNAGHNPPLLCRAGQEELMALERTGLPLGLFEFTDFEAREVRLDPGDSLVLYTDGVTEAIDVQQREFGEERLRRVLLEVRGASAEAMAAAVEEALRAFTGAAAPSDDITYLILKRV